MPFSPDSTDTHGAGTPAVRHGLLTAGLIGLALFAAGCGGSSSSSSSSTATSAASTITKAQFIARANAICAKDDPQLSEATAKLSTLRSPAALAAAVRSTFVPAIESQVQEIHALGTPSGEAAQTAALLHLVQADVNKLMAHPALVSTDVFADFAKVAHPYGLTSCAPLS